jgi:hypothetical protein
MNDDDHENMRQWLDHRLRRLKRKLEFMERTEQELGMLDWLEKEKGLGSTKTIVDDIIKKASTDGG